MRKNAERCKGRKIAGLCNIDFRDEYWLAVIFSRHGECSASEQACFQIRSFEGRDLDVIKNFAGAFLDITTRTFTPRKSPRERARSIATEAVKNFRPIVSVFPTLFFSENYLKSEAAEFFWK